MPFKDVQQVEIHQLKLFLFQWWEKRSPAEIASCCFLCYENLHFHPIIFLYLRYMDVQHYSAITLLVSMKIRHSQFSLENALPANKKHRLLMEGSACQIYYSTLSFLQIVAGSDWVSMLLWWFLDKPLMTASNWAGLFRHWVRSWLVGSALLFAVKAKPSKQKWERSTAGSDQ